MHTNGKIFDFNIFRRPPDFIRSIFSGDISLEQATEKQEKMEHLLRNMDAYKPRNSDKVNLQKKFLKMQEHLFKEEN